jgi:spore coat polysaccharide biosynthesis protein SpsF
MKIGALVQARMSSSRFPGKVLHPLLGRPSLDYLLERLEHARGLDLFAVVTSIDRSDDPVVTYCEGRNVSCYRGPLDDVLGRFVEAVKHFELDAAVRVNGDSLFLDQSLVEMGTGLFRETSVDLVTNIHPRTFPIGQSVEVIAGRALLSAEKTTAEPDDREHVTPFFYRRPDLFRIENFSADEDQSAERLALDTPGDASVFEAMLSRMDRPHTDYTWLEVLRLRGRVMG